MAALTVYEVDRVKGFFALLATFGIGISALLIKQHYIADIVGDFAISVLAYYIYFKQRIIEVLRRDLRRLPVVLDHYIDEVLDKRLESLIDKKLEAKIKRLLSGDNDRDEK